MRTLGTNCKHSEAVHWRTTAYGRQTDACVGTYACLGDRVVRSGAGRADLRRKAGVLVLQGSDHMRPV